MKLFQLIHLLLQLNAFVFLFQTVTSVLFVIYYLKGGWLKRSISKAKLEA